MVGPYSVRARVQGWFFITRKKMRILNVQRGKIETKVP